jgi:hypothetical protein
MALKQKWFVLEEHDLEHRDGYAFALTHPSREYYGQRDSIFNHYGYDTKEEALAAIESKLNDPYYKYKSYFVIDRWELAE